VLPAAGRFSSWPFLHSGVLFFPVFSRVFEVGMEENHFLSYGGRGAVGVTSAVVE
jgi:hypothetical protein